MVGAAEEESQTSPQSKRKTRLWPIPPIVRVGTPRTMVNATVSLNTGGTWKPTKANVEPVFTRFYCDSPVSARLPISRSLGSQSHAAWELVATQPTLLEVLGMASPATGDAAPSRLMRSRFPRADKMKDPQECEDGCYWRWLTHTLLEDAGALKKNLSETQEGLQALADKRQNLQDTIRHYGRLIEELADMDGSLKKLRETVPKLRERSTAQQKETHELQQRHQQLQEKQKELHSAVKRSVEWQKANEKKVKIAEREAEEGRRQEKTMGDQLHADREKVHQAGVELQFLTSDYQTLQAEVKELEEKKAEKKAAKSQGKKAKK